MVNRPVQQLIDGAKGCEGFKDHPLLMGAKFSVRRVGKALS